MLNQKLFYIILGIVLGLFVVILFSAFKAGATYRPTPIPTIEITPTPAVVPTPTTEPTATPSATPIPEQRNDTSNNQAGTAPVCPEQAITKASVNFHILRKEDKAIAKWWPNTDANKASIYYKQASSSDWQYSITTDNTGYVEINELGSLDITFALQEHRSCGGGNLTEHVVDGVSDTWVLYR